MCTSAAARPLSRAQCLGFAAFGILAVLEPGLWARWALKHDLSLLWSGALPADLLRWKLAVFALWQLALLSCYVALFAATWRRLSAR